MSNKMFEEAIADAKKLREVAEANAKKAVLEAVTPKIREFIESELLESQHDELKEEDVEERAGGGQNYGKSKKEADEVDEVTLDEAALQKLSTLLGLDISKEITHTENTKMVSEATQAAYRNLTASQKRELNNIADKINQTKRTLSGGRINNKEANLKENSKMSEKFYEVDLNALREAVEEELNHAIEAEVEEEGYDAADEGDDHDLAEMLQELKLVLDLGDDIEEDQIPEELRGMLEEDEEGEDDADLDMAEEDEEAPEGEEAPEAPEGEEGGEDPFAAQLDEMEEVEIDETMLAEEILRIRKLVREGKMDHHFGGKGGSKAGVKGAFGGSGSGKAGVKKAFGGGSEGQDIFTNPPAMNKLAEAFRAERRKNRALSEKLGKYRSAVDTLREQLEDLNLFNAKLLYVNKLLQNKNLNESEKKSVIKALDEANSLREAKSLYKSLTETFARGNAKPLTESRNRGSSSRPTTSSAPKQGKAPELDRWQRLAGLKN